VWRPRSSTDRSTAACCRVAEYWPGFGANGKGEITLRDVLRHRSGLSHLKGVSKDELLDHELMEKKLAAASVDHLRGRPEYHALTYGWLLSGIARSVTGMGMRELIREEVARPLNTDGLHLGRPPADAPTRVAQILAPQSTRANPVFNFVAPKVAGLPLSGAFGAMFFPGIKSFVQGDIPFLDGEVPAANGVVTARGLAKMYAAIANGGSIDGTQFLSAELTQALIGQPKPWPDLNIVVPMPFHLGYHESPIPGLLKGFGHIGLGGTFGWADPGSGSAFAFVHNRLLTPMVLDMASFAGLARPLRNAITAARHTGPVAVPKYGARYREPAASKRVAGRR
jgi:CubicO group peptidase (beta-lactamase class C family)